MQMLTSLVITILPGVAMTRLVSKKYVPLPLTLLSSPLSILRRLADLFQWGLAGRKILLGEYPTPDGSRSVNHCMPASF